MTVTRRLATLVFGTALSVAAAVFVAAPASAIVPPADGVYVYNQAGAPTSNWSLKSICIQANGTRQQSDYTDETIQTLGCIVSISSILPSPPVDLADNLMTFGGRARLINGLWTYQRTVDNGLACTDGSSAPLTETFAFTSPDPASPNPSLTGTRTSIHDAGCGLEPAMVKVPFSLTFVGGPPVGPPVIHRFPDNCNYLVGRPSICS